MDDITPGRVEDPIIPEPSGETSIPIKQPVTSVPSPEPAPTPITIGPGTGPSVPTPPSSPLPSVDPVAPPRPSVPSAPSSPAAAKAPEVPQTVSGGPVRDNGNMVKKLLPWIAGAVLAIIAAGGVYFWQNQRINDLTVQHQSDRDVLNSKIASLEAVAAEREKKQTDDKEAIVKVLTAECQAEPASKTFSVNTIKIEGSFATATNGCDLKTRTTARTTTATLKKVGDNWVLIYEGIAQPPVAIRTQYGIPATLYD